MKRSTMSMINNIINVTRYESNRIPENEFADTPIEMYIKENRQKENENIEGLLEGRDEVLKIRLHRKGYMILDFYFDKKFNKGKYVRETHKVSIENFFRNSRLSKLEWGMSI